MNFNFDMFNGVVDTINSQYYEKLKNNVNNIIYYLSKSIDELESVDGILIKDYNINDDIVKNVSIKFIKEELINKINYLRSYVIPSINMKIK